MLHGAASRLSLQSQWAEHSRLRRWPSSCLAHQHLCLPDNAPTVVIRSGGCSREGARHRRRRDTRCQGRDPAGARDEHAQGFGGGISSGWQWGCGRHASSSTAAARFVRSLEFHPHVQDCLLWILGGCTELSAERYVQSSEFAPMYSSPLDAHKGCSCTLCV